MRKRPLGEQISRMLAARGVDTIFGIPGVHNIELYRGLEHSGLTHVLARHEQGAGFMADGYARATGRPGVAYVITGPGLTNIMTPMGQAYSDSVPLLVISSCLDEHSATRGQLHQMRDQAAAARSVCAWSEEARSAEAAYALIDRAFVEFASHRRRPRHIQVPIALAGGMAEAFPAWTGPIVVQQDNPAMYHRAAGALSSAKRPLFVFGGGAVALGLDGLAEALMQKTGGACFATYAGRGIVSPDNPLNFGSYLGRPGSAEVISSADLVIVIGSELSETDLWRSDLGHAAHMIRVDIDPEVLADAHNAEIKVLADAEGFAAQVLDILGDVSPVPGWGSPEVADARRKWRAETDAERPGIVPICEALRAALPNDTMVFSDMTQFAYVAKEVWDMPAPGLWHHPTGFGTLGYALPAAIGAKAGLRDRPVVAIAGDYGFQYTIQELGTAAELGLPLPILLWDNQMLKEIEASMTSAQIAPVAVKALNPDFGDLAKAYGLGYAKPADLAELQDEVKAALTADGPVLIHMTPDMSGS